MAAARIYVAKAWLAQAESDVRTAQALAMQPRPLKSGDVGCHVAAHCAQAIEKSIKGYLLLNDYQPKMSHRADKYIVPILDGSLKLSDRDHHNHLSKLFNSKTKSLIRELIDFTPGTRGKSNVPNTEYPWEMEREFRTPFGAADFTDKVRLEVWLSTAAQVVGLLSKLWSEVSRKQPPPAAEHLTQELSTTL